jgi:hypothetical protein
MTIKTALFGGEPPRGGGDGAQLPAVGPPHLPATEAPFVVPATGPVWRWVLPTPPDVRDVGAGLWCPMCDGLLDVASTGWVCQALSCQANWDFHGRHGSWEGTR